MKAVSPSTASVLIQLVAWEMLNKDSKVDPKALLRSLPNEELNIVHTNVSSDEKCLEYTTVQMVDLELQYRMGLLVGDWSYERNDKCVKLSYTPAHSGLKKRPPQLRA